jgi:protein-L-isoaspartate O-methyltransferase
MKPPQDETMHHPEVKETNPYIKSVLSLLMIFAIPLILVIRAVFIIFTILFNVFIGFKEAPWVATQPETVEKMIALANIKPGAKAADIGSGDGRLVIALAQAGAEAHGYEINPFLVLLSRLNISQAGLTSKAFVHWKNFWNEDLSKFDIVIVYGTPKIMKRLEEKLKKELKTDATIISNIYAFPTWSPSKREDNVYLYEHRMIRDVPKLTVETHDIKGVPLEVKKTKPPNKFLRYSFIILFFPVTLPIILFNVFAYLFKGAVFVPTGRMTVRKMIDLANVKPGVKAVDIGCGDGRLVIALAKAGAEAHGYEIHPFLVWMSKRNIRKARLAGKAFIHRKSFWDEDLSNFDIVTVYGVPKIMERLEEKLKKELGAGARVVSNKYTFPTWPESKREDNVYLYEQKVK